LKQDKIGSDSGANPDSSTKDTHECEKGFIVACKILKPRNTHSDRQ